MKRISFDSERETWWALDGPRPNVLLRPDHEAIHYAFVDWRIILWCSAAAVDGASSPGAVLAFDETVLGKIPPYSLADARRTTDEFRSRLGRIDS